MLYKLRRLSLLTPLPDASQVITSKPSVSEQFRIMDAASREVHLIDGIMFDSVLGNP